MYITDPDDAYTAHWAPVLWRVDTWRAPADLEEPVQGIISGVNLAQLAAGTVTLGGAEGAVLEITANCIDFELPSVGVTGSHDAVVPSGQLMLKLAATSLACRRCKAVGTVLAKGRGKAES